MKPLAITSRIFTALFLLIAAFAHAQTNPDVVDYCGHDEWLEQLLGDDVFYELYHQHNETLIQHVADNQGPAAPPPALLPVSGTVKYLIPVLRSVDARSGSVADLLSNVVKVRIRRRSRFHQGTPRLAGSTSRSQPSGN